MHLLPAYRDDRARINSIDPGSNTLGFCSIEFSVNTLEIYSTEATTFIGDKMSTNHYFASVHGDRFGRINAHEDNLYRLFQYHQPLVVVSESPFYSSRRPTAFQALLEVINAIRCALLRHDPSMCLEQIDPPSVKKAVGALGNAGKDDVKAAVLKLTDLNFQGPVPLAMLDEHSIDAIAVGYSKLQEYRRHRHQQGTY
jgi:Holliday junction resolvasome RuvABC endonuclease subunit